MTAVPRHTAKNGEYPDSGGYGCPLRRRRGRRKSAPWPPGKAGEEAGAGPAHTDPAVAVRFVEDTGIDALAPSFGTAHGVYRSKPRLDLERVETIRNLTGLPLVMHGAAVSARKTMLPPSTGGIRRGELLHLYVPRRVKVRAAKRLEEGEVTFFTILPPPPPPCSGTSNRRCAYSIACRFSA